MKQKSHYLLGKYLAAEYMSGAAQLQKTAFLIGCMEPDWNPLTYLKGSFKIHPLHGHHYANARNWISCHTRKLMLKPPRTVFGFYALGKLTHYLADAFTGSHNDTLSLHRHRKYEIVLQSAFLAMLSQKQENNVFHFQDPLELIRKNHSMYRLSSPDVFTDSSYIISITSQVLEKIMQITFAQ